MIGICNKCLFNNNQIKWYVCFLGFILFIEMTNKLLIYGLKLNNISFTYPAYIAGEYFILSKLFISHLKFSKKWFFVSILMSTALFLEASVLWNNNHDFTQGYGKTLSHLTIISLSAYLLIKGLKKLEKFNPFLIVYAALFLYYTVSLLLFLLMDQLNESNSIIWFMNNILLSILYSCSIYTFYRLKKL